LTKYYSAQDLADISTAKTYIELLEIALRIIESIEAENPGIPMAMVCGPISTGGKGSRNENLKIFERAIDRLAGGGLLIFSQMPFESDMERIYKSDPRLQGLRLLDEFYAPIFRTGLVSMLCFLPGWEKSIGANWEHQQATILNIPRIYLAEHYVKD